MTQPDPTTVTATAAAADHPLRVWVIYGTRPEGIKVAPLVHVLERSPLFAPVAISTKQHRGMLEQVNEVLDLHPALTDHLDVFQPGQGVNELLSKVIAGVDRLIVEAPEPPDCIVVQGDTTTAAGTAIAAFNRDVPLVHMEAGLRSWDIRSPFPEEANRRLISLVASLHLAPSERARHNLLGERIPADRVIVTGNTVIDALKYITAKDLPVTDPRLRALLDSGRPYILVTTHRRENWGEPLRHIGAALAALAAAHPEIDIFIPLHGNPMIHATLAPFIDSCENIIVTTPLSYPDFVHAMSRAHVILSDSGGVQEEAPTFGVPVLLLRETTERPSAVASGAVRLVGTDRDRIVAETEQLLTDSQAWARMAHASNPYGDGHAAELSAAALADLLTRTRSE